MSENDIELTNEEYLRLWKLFLVNPEKYSAPFRIYLDVDGVILPFRQFKYEEPIRELDERASITYMDSRVMGRPVSLRKTEIGYDSTVISRLSDLSKRDDVDLVWLSSWRASAPHAFDAPLDIKSVGFLDWDQKFSDYTQVFKGVAIREEQEAYPSKFVWIDDLANHRDNYGIVGPDGKRPKYFSDSEWSWENGEDDDNPTWVEEHRIHPDRYLTITTERNVGLTSKQLDEIEQWMEGNR